MRGVDVRCPECGRVWSVQWLKENEALPPPPKGWLYAPLVGLVLGLPFGSANWVVGFLAVWFVSGLCWGIAFGKLAKPRHGDFAAVLASFMGPIAGIAWAAICALLWDAIRTLLML